MSVTTTWRCDYCGAKLVVPHDRKAPKGWIVQNDTLPQVQAFAAKRAWVFCDCECEAAWHSAVHSAYLQAQNTFFGSIRAHQIHARTSAIDSLADLCDNVTAETFAPLKYDPPKKTHGFEPDELPF